MKVDITYPDVPKKSLHRKKLIRAGKWLCFVAACACPTVNLCTGGKAWSLIVLMSLYMVWKMILSPDLVEYNRISQFIKLIVYSGILLILIDVFLAPGWAIEVVPIVCFCGLAVSGVLFFTDLERQKQNMQPMLLLIILSLIGSGVGLPVWQEESRWALAVMGMVALVLLIACIATLGSDFLRELKRRFHVK